MQQFVTCAGKKEKRVAIAWLEGHGFENVQRLTAEGYSFPVLVVESDAFFGTNVTCMAALASQGKRAIPWKTWLAAR